MKIILLFVGHLRSNPKLAIKNNLDFFSEVFPDTPIISLIHTYDTDGCQTKRKNSMHANTDIGLSQETLTPDLIEEIKLMPTIQDIFIEEYNSFDQSVQEDAASLASYDARLKPGMFASIVGCNSKLVRAVRWLESLKSVPLHNNDIIVRLRPDVYLKKSNLNGLTLPFGENNFNYVKPKSGYVYQSRIPLLARLSHLTGFNMFCQKIPLVGERIFWARYDVFCDVIYQFFDNIGNLALNSYKINHKFILWPRKLVYQPEYALGYYLRSSRHSLKRHIIDLFVIR